MLFHTHQITKLILNKLLNKDEKIKIKLNLIYLIIIFMFHNMIFYSLFFILQFRYYLIIIKVFHLMINISYQNN